MVPIENYLRKSPTIVLLRALITRNHLLTLDPVWFNNPNELQPYGLLLVQSGFWLPVKQFRLIHRNKMHQVIAAMQKAIAFSNLAIFISSIFAANSLIQLLDIYSSRGEHFALNIFIIGMYLILFPGILLLWKGRVKVKDFPIANVNESVLSAKKKINIAFWFFNIVAIVFTAILAVLKTSAPRSGGGEDAIEIISNAQETATEKLPELVTDAASVSSQGATSIASSLGLGILRIIFGGGITVGSTFLLLETLSLTKGNEAALFVIFGIAAVMIIIWEIYIYQKYRVA